jgi:hypothetical protein
VGCRGQRPYSAVERYGAESRDFLCSRAVLAKFSSGRASVAQASQVLPYVGRSSRFNLVGGTNKGGVNRFAWIGWFKIGAVVYLKNRRTAEMASRFY